MVEDCPSEQSIDTAFNAASGALEPVGIGLDSGEWLIAM